jgi:peptidoglycan-associated lipoprotein
MTLRNRTTRTLAVLLPVTFAALAACKTNPPQTAAAAVPPSTPAAASERTVAPPAGSSTARDVEPDITKQDIRVLNEKGYLKPAFFDYAKADLRDDARAALAADAEWLKRYPSFQFVVEGHCDERGTEAYNLALGEQRAAAAKDYLSALGVDASRIRTVSYGKERPFCTEPADPCWQSNRRDHFLITAK